MRWRPELSCPHPTVPPQGGRMLVCPWWSSVGFLGRLCHCRAQPASKRGGSPVPKVPKVPEEAPERAFRRPPPASVGNWAAVGSVSALFFIGSWLRGERGVSFGVCIPDTHIHIHGNRAFMKIQSDSREGSGSCAAVAGGACGGGTGVGACVSWSQLCVPRGAGCLRCWG